MESKYKEYLKLNKNLLIAFVVDVLISTIVADTLSGEESYINSTVTVIVDFSTYFSVFLLLFLFDNRSKYKKNSDDTHTLRGDLLKVVASLGVGEVVYLLNRWFWQFHFINMGTEAYQASLIAQGIAFVIFLIVTNVMVKLTKLHK